AALDPKTASLVTNITNKLVAENKATTLMVTHNIKDALKMGNKTIVMSEGKIILSLKGDERKNITPGKLLNLYSTELISDKMLF
ncbi:MAG: ABC transporter ATP-binding protein, partial [Clostridiales Family XIII bacterium]|nr:ABC transporter ATP-binding protein [Clostridiales Family XIII bacterium]